MTQLGLTQADVARGCELSNSTVSDWFTKESYPEGAALIRIRKLLKCSLDWLVTGEGPVEGAARDVVRERSLRQEGAFSVLERLRETCDAIENTWVRAGPSPRAAAEAADAAFPKAAKRRQKRANG